MLRIYAILALSFPLLFAADLTGQWEAKLKTGGREFPLHVELRQFGNQLTGAFGYRADFLWPLAECRLDSDGKLRFVLTMPSGPSPAFEGSVTGETITGTLTSSPPGMSGPFEMKKVGPPSRLPAPFVPNTFSEPARLSDEFQHQDSLRQWTLLSDAEQLPARIDRMDVGATSPGHLFLLPKSAAWWAGYHGAYLFKLVKGDFLVTTRVNVTGRDGGEPGGIWTLSGLLVRAPGDQSVALESRKENWVYLMTGRGPADARVVDAKSTVNNINAYDIIPARSGWYELRIARIGPVFLLYCRPDGAAWQFRKLVMRPDLPQTLQVGINVTSDFKLSASMPAAKYNAAIFEGKAPVDAATLVDWVRFTPLSDRRHALAAIAGKAILDLSDAELLRVVE